LGEVQSAYRRARDKRVDDPTLGRPVTDAEVNVSKQHYRELNVLWADSIHYLEETLHDSRERHPSVVQSVSPDS
jgi:hypothetical protein